MKYALIVDNKVVQISYPYVEGYVEVDDNVFADMIKKSNGTFDYSDEFKAEHIKVDTYKDNRKMAYPSIADQLDMLYWDKVNGTENWLNSIESVKNRFPKA
jgi:hypothetical protein